MRPAIVDAIAAIPPSPWAVGVSGGADSVALLLLLHDRPELSLRVVHIDHQLRRAESDADAAFVADLAAQLGVPCDIFCRSDIETSMADLPANPSARYRAVRLEAFGRVVAQHALHGVILAHHADDVAETVLQRLLRGSGAAGLGGIAADAHVGRLTIIRPLLAVHRAALRQVLADRNQGWREDQSNASAKYLRNRLRRLLADHPELTQATLELAAACQAWSGWLHRLAPALPSEFPVGALASLPDPIARESARRWLVQAGAPPGELSPAVLDRLGCMAADAATPSHQSFPGPVDVRRRAGIITPT
jgi:tRNA(Ile)-lysidine synthetase-like protein